MSTSVLSFIVEPLNPPDEMALAAEPVIDGRRLSDLVKDFEISRGFQPAGGYGGLVFEFFNSGPLKEYFCSKEAIAVLGCDCGEVGCWPLECEIRVEVGAITWDKFSQPHRPDRDYSTFGPFTFDFDQYSDAISALHQNVSGAR